MHKGYTIKPKKKPSEEKTVKAPEKVPEQKEAPEQEEELPEKCTFCFKPIENPDLDLCNECKGNQDQNLREQKEI